MRFALAIVMTTLTVVVGSRPMLAQVRDNVPALDSIHMIDAMTGWAVTRNQRSDGEPAMGVARTTDGGSTWRDVTPTIGGLSRLSALPQVFVFTADFAWVESFRTVDGGRTWRPIPISSPGGGLVWIDFVNAHDGWALVWERAGYGVVEMVVHRSADAGETWTRTAEHSRLHQSVASLTFVTRTTGWATLRVPTAFGAGADRFWAPLFVTRDAGRTWIRQDVPPPLKVTPPWDSRAMPVRFYTARDGILPVLYANVDRQSHARIASFAIAYATHDAGATWTYTTPVSVSDQAWRTDYYGAPLWDMHFVDIKHGWIVEGTSLYATLDGGRQWTMLRPTSFPGAKQLDFISPKVGWAVARQAPFLLKTLDGGYTWAPVSYTIRRQ